MPARNDTIYSKCLKKNAANQDYCIQQCCAELKKCFPDKQKLKEFIIIKPALQEMLKGFPEAETKGFQLQTRKYKFH